MHIAICGPCSPEGLRDVLFPAERLRAKHFPGFGGIGVQQLARSLVQGGHTVTVVTTAANDEFTDSTFSGPRLQVIAVPRRSAGAAIRDVYRVERQRLTSAIRDAGPDLVHAHWTYEFELAAQDSGVPHVTTTRDAPATIYWHAKDRYRLARWAVALVARSGIHELSTVSPYLAWKWRSQMLYRKSIEVIPNPIPGDISGHNARSGTTPIILEVADASRRKNVWTLLKALAIVRRMRPETRLRLAGAGLAADSPLAEQARSARLADGVEFLGPIERRQLSDEIASAWVFAHASLEESFGISVLEAIAAGVPTVGGIQSGGVPYVLGQGRAGLLVDVSNPKILASAITELINEGTQTLVEDPAKFAQTNFGAQNVADRYVSWYQRILD